MNKKLLAAAIAAATFGTQAVAVELYNKRWHNIFDGRPRFC